MSQARRQPMTFEQFLDELIAMTEIYDGLDDLDPIQDEANE